AWARAAEPRPAQAPARTERRGRGGGGGGGLSISSRGGVIAGGAPVGGGGRGEAVPPKELTPPPRGTTPRSPSPKGRGTPPTTPPQTCWSTRIGFPSGSTARKLAGPVVPSSASVTSCTPWAFSRRWSSRTSVKAASFWALLSQPGLKVRIFLSNIPWKRPM